MEALGEFGAQRFGKFENSQTVQMNRIEAYYRVQQNRRLDGFADTSLCVFDVVASTGCQ